MLLGLNLHSRTKQDSDSASLLSAIGQLSAGAVVKSEKQTVASSPGVNVQSGRQDLRPEIDRVIREELDPLGANLTEAQVDAFLAKLEDRALTKGRVDGPEVEPGVQAIRRLGHRLGTDRVMAKTSAFAERMSKLAASLRKQRREKGE